MADTTTPDAAPKAGSADSADPSMEEILASIRRILNEDEAAPAPEADADADADADVDDDVLVLDQSMLVSPATAEPHVEIAEKPMAPAVEPDEDDFNPPPLAPIAPAKLPEPVVLAREPEPEPVPLVMPVMPAPPAAEMLAPEAAAAAASSISSLVRTLSAGRATQVYSAGPTLEDIVRAELRPLLKEWLDSYLPPLVERLVRVEIERVVGRAVP